MTLFFGLNPSLQHRRWYVPGSSHSDHPPPECSRTSPSPKHPIWKHVGQPPWFLKIWLNMLQDALLPGTHRMWSNWRKFMSKQTTHVKHLWWAAPHAAGAKFFRKAGDKTQPCSSWAHLPTEHLPFLQVLFFITLSCSTLCCYWKHTQNSFSKRQGIYLQKRSSKRKWHHVDTVKRKHPLY